MDQQQQQPPLPPSLSNSNSNSMTPETTGGNTAAVDVVKDKIITAASPSSPSSIFHVLLLPGGNIQKDLDETNNNNTPHVIIDDYLYQRHVYRKQAAARLSRPSVGGAVKINETNDIDAPKGDIALNLVASPLEIALASCCVRPPNNTSDTDATNNSNNNSSTSSTQRSRLHRPILPSNAADETTFSSDGQQLMLLDTPRTISMKDPTTTNDTNFNNNSDTSATNNKKVGTLQKGEEAHFLKLLQMYCPQCKEGLPYRSLVVEILQRTADWENGVYCCLGSSSFSDGDGGVGAMNLANSNSNSSNGKKVGQVGYTFRKQFHSGWYTGQVTHILPKMHGTTTAATVKDRRCLYNDGDEEDLSLEELKHLAELEELDRYHHDDDDNNDGGDEQEKIKTEAGGGDGNNGHNATTKEEGEKKNESTQATHVAVGATPVGATPPSPPVVNPTNNNNKNKHTVMKTFLAVGGMKLLARWLVEAYTVVQAPPSSNQSNKRKSPPSQKGAEATIVSPSPTGTLLIPLLTLLKSIPFDKDIIVASSIHKYIKRYKKALDKLSKGMDAQSLNAVLHPLAGGGSVGRVMRGVEEVMTSWNNATAAAAANTKSQHDDDNGGDSDEKQQQQQHQQLDPYKEVRDQLQSRFDELAAFHNNRTNPPEWVPKHVLGVVMASPKAAPASPTGSSKPTLSASSMKSNNTTPSTKSNKNEWGTNRASAAQIARERFLEGFRKQKDAVSSPPTSTSGLIPSPPEKMQKVAHGNDRSSSSSRRVCWVDQPMGRKGVKPEPLVTERVFVKEEEYVAEEDVVEMNDPMFGGDDDDVDVALPMQEDVIGSSYQGDTVMEVEGVQDDQDDSDLDDMF